MHRSLALSALMRSVKILKMIALHRQAVSTANVWKSLFECGFLCHALADLSGM